MANTEANAKVFKALAALRMRKRRAAMSSWAAFAAAGRQSCAEGPPHSATVACARASTLGRARIAPSSAAYGLGRAEWRGTGLRELGICSSAFARGRL